MRRSIVSRSACLVIISVIFINVINAKPYKTPSENLPSINPNNDNVEFCRNNQLIRVPVSKRNVAEIPCWTPTIGFQNGAGILLYKGSNDTNLSLISGNITQQDKIIKYVKKSGFLYNFTGDQTDSDSGVLGRYTCFIANSSRRNFVAVEVYRDDNIVSVSSSDCSVSYYKNNRGTFFCRAEGIDNDTKFEWFFTIDGGKDRDVDDLLIEEYDLSVADGVVVEEIRVKLPQSDITGVGCRIKYSSNETFEGVQTVDVEDVNPPVILYSTQTDKELTCTFSVVDKSQIIVDWFKDGKPLEEGRTKEYYGSGLGIASLRGFSSDNDVTNYTCVVRNEGDSEFSSSSFLVYRPNYLVYVYVISAIATGVLAVMIVRWMRQLDRMIKGFKGVRSLERNDPLNSSLIEIRQTSDKWKFLAKGVNGDVWLSEIKYDNEPKVVVLKTYSLTPFSSYKTAELLFEDLNNEIKICQKLSRQTSHGGYRYIVRYQGFYVRSLLKLQVYLILEYCEAGQMQKFLKNRKDSFVNDINYQTRRLRRRRRDNEKLKTSHLIKWAVQIAKGMVLLHQQNIVHRDLAARNILLEVLAGTFSTDDIISKIADFGMARDLEESQSYFIFENTKLRTIPFAWYPPESIGFENVGYTKKSDVWSFGVLLWEIFSLGSCPVDSYKFNGNYEALKEGLVKGKRLLRKSMQKIPDEMWTLMKDCWKLEPNDRPDFPAILQRLEEISDSYGLNEQRHANAERRVQLAVITNGSVVINPNYHDLQSDSRL